MKPNVRLLLPILNSEDLDLFISTPAEALLSPGNLPALAAEVKVILCLLSTIEIAEKFELTVFRNAILKFSELLLVSVDDLVLDDSFEVVPSLAYQKGIAGSGPVATETVFIFLQPNLVLADGALQAIYCQIQSGVRVLRATNLRVDRVAFQKTFVGSAVGTRFASRTIVKHALECLDLEEIGSFLNSDAPLIGSARRLIWRHEATTLLAYDFARTLIALWPTSVVTKACGFRDSTFAELMCSDGSSHDFVDSDEFCGIEIAEPAVSNNSIRFGSHSLAARARALATCTTRADRQSAVQFPVIFHADELPRAFVNPRRKMDSRVRRIIDAMGPAEGTLLRGRWTLAYYLWRVRSFELGRGLLPNEPFSELFLHSRANQLRRDAAVESRPSVVRLSRKTFLPMGLLRWLRQRFLGRVPIVSFLHPEWASYRHVEPLLRQAVRRPRTEVAYVADGIALFSRVLGQPDFTAAELIEGAQEGHLWASETLTMAIFELTSASFGHCAALTMAVLPSLKPGGQIVIYHRNEAELSFVALSSILKGFFVKLGARRVMRTSMFVVTATPYRRWLNDGFPLALRLARTRRLVDLAYAGALVILVSGLTAVANIVSQVSPREVSALEPCSSVTIIIPADGPTRL
jgi:hypothetical protein